MHPVQEEFRVTIKRAERRIFWMDFEVQECLSSYHRSREFILMFMRYGCYLNSGIPEVFFCFCLVSKWKLPFQQSSNAEVIDWNLSRWHLRFGIEPPWSQRTQMSGKVSDILAFLFHKWMYLCIYLHTYSRYILGREWENGLRLI